MASTFSTNLAIELIGTGDQAGTWGTTTNSNLGTLIEQAISGYVTQAVATGTDTTITIPNGATGVARNMYIELTGTGGTNTNLIVPANKKLYFIFNNSTGAVTVKVSGQTGVSVPTGKKMVLVSNGTDIVNGLNYIADFGTNSFSVTNLTASSGTITNLIATSGSITNLVSSDASATVLRAGSATLTHLSATSASITNLSLTSLTISSLSITNVSVASATVSSNLTLSGGTANGVLYLNGSKVATSGSALVFDGTNLGVGTASPGAKLDVTGNARILNSGADSQVIVVAPTDSFAPFVRWGVSGIRDSGILGFPVGDDSLVYRSGANSFSTGTERFRITLGGNVGIGTASPAYKLDVTGTSTTALSAAGFTNNSSANNTTKTVGVTFRLADTVGVIKDSAYITAFPDGANVLSAGVAFSTRTGDANPTEKMRLDSSGNLGLGVTPSAWDSGYKALQIGQAASFWGATGSNFTTITNNAIFDGAYKYKNNGIATQYVMGTGGTHAWNIAASGTAGNTISFTQAMTLDASGNLGLGETSPATRLHIKGANTSLRGQLSISGASGASSRITFYVDADYNAFINSGSTLTELGTVSATPVLFYTSNTERARITSGGDFQVGATNLAIIAKGADTNGQAWNGAQTSLYVGSVNGTGRSINAAGTVNASGADYAEYMEKVGEFVIAKGDVCGINAEGKLTNLFADAISFVVKSTNPSYVGGDSWGAEFKDDPEGLEAARQKVDRIAFAGQVPVNVLGATPGQYIVPINDNGAIKGVAVSNPTFEQYQSAVGKVIAVQDDGRALIIVKVA